MAAGDKAPDPSAPGPQLCNGDTYYQPTPRGPSAVKICPPPHSGLSRTGRELWALALTDWPLAGGRGGSMLSLHLLLAAWTGGPGLPPCQAWPAPLGCLSQGQPEHEGLGRPQTAKA